MPHIPKLPSLAGAILVALFNGAIATTPASAVSVPIGITGYSSLVTPLPNNLPSIGAEAYEFAHLGNEISPVSSAQPVQSANVELSTWACQTQGPSSTGSCVTTPGATFPVAITITFFAVGSNQSLGTSLASLTQTVAVPYRPSTTANCLPGSGWGATCSGGKAVIVTLDLTSLHFVLPSPVIYTISYNTMHQGLHPTGIAGPADSVNVALSSDPTNVTVGTDSLPGTIWWDTQHPSNFSDGGSGGTGVLRLDSPNVPSCWGTANPASSPFYVPAVSFIDRAVTESHITSDSPPATTVGDRYYFHVVATGDNPQTFTVSAGALPPGLTIDERSGAMTGSARHSGHFMFRIAVSGPYASTSTAYVMTVARAASTPIINAGSPTSRPRPLVFLLLTGVGTVVTLTGISWLFMLSRRRP